MTRFKHLISHDLEGVFTPTQIGRRLQQLGCVQPRKRRSILADMSDDQGENHQYKSSTDDDHRSETEEVSNDSDKMLGISKMNILPGSDSGFKASWGSSARKNVQKKSEAGNIKPNCKKPDSTIPNEKEILSQESGSDDDLPIAQHMSVKRIFGRRITRPEPEQKIRIKDGFESRESDSDDDEPIVHKMSTKETPKRREEVQQEQMEVVSGIVDIEGEQPVQKSPKRTYERKQKPDQQHMEKDTWGDTDTGNISVALF